MKEQGKQHLDKAIGQLKGKIAPSFVWENIEEELDGDQEKGKHYLKRAIKDLPTLAMKLPSSDSIFENIIQKDLEEKSPRLIQSTQKLGKKTYWIAGIAASITLVIGFWLGSLSNPAVIEISYSEQEVKQEENILPVLKMQLHEEDEVLEFIQSNCKTVQLVCNEPDFKVLLEEYIALENDRKELLETMKAQQEPERLMRYLVRVEKKKTELGKQLLQQLI
ncbi:MAG: hypothetical protein ACI85I_001179 [Arenicella sp.]|jgi:hypothetical protein